MARRSSVIGQMFMMIKEKKSYWLVPVFAVFFSLIILSILATFGGGAMAPFIYTLF